MFIPSDPQQFEGLKFKHPVMWANDLTLDASKRPWSVSPVGSLYMYMPTATWYRKVADNKDANDWADGISPGTDHGALTGLGDDDHPQYLNEARGDARYAQPADYIEYVSSLGGGGLIQNGSGLYEDNTNFPDFAFDPLVVNNSRGSFRHEGSLLAAYTSAAFTILPSLAYKASADVRVSSTATAIQRIGMAFFDSDDLPISAAQHMFLNGTKAALTRDFTVGDVNIYVTNVTGFDFSTTLFYQQGLIFWNYEDSNGFQYPANTYSRYQIWDLWEAGVSPVDIGGGEWRIPVNTSGLNLREVAGSQVFPAGTEVSQSTSGSTFKYTVLASVVNADEEWHSFSGYLGGVDQTGTNRVGAIPPGSKTAKVYLQLNNASDTIAEKIWVANLDIRVATEVDLVEDGSVATTGALGAIDYTRGFRPTATASGVSSTAVIL